MKALATSGDEFTDNPFSRTPPRHYEVRVHTSELAIKWGARHAPAISVTRNVTNAKEPLSSLGRPLKRGFQPPAPGIPIGFALPFLLSDILFRIEGVIDWS